MSEVHIGTNPSTPVKFVLEVTVMEVWSENDLAVWQERFGPDAAGETRQRKWIAASAGIMAWSARLEDAIGDVVHRAVDALVDRVRVDQIRIGICELKGPQRECVVMDYSAYWNPATAAHFVEFSRREKEKRGKRTAKNEQRKAETDLMTVGAAGEVTCTNLPPGTVVTAAGEGGR